MLSCEKEAREQTDHILEEDILGTLEVKTQIVQYQENIVRKFYFSLRSIFFRGIEKKEISPAMSCMSFQTKPHRKKHLIWYYSGLMRCAFVIL